MKLPKRNKIDSQKTLKLDIDEYYHQEIYYKPRGFWYSCYDSWFNFLEITNELNNMKYRYIHKINIKPGKLTTLDKPNPNKLLVIKTAKEIDKFDEIFGISTRDGRLIDWVYVAANFGGIEICPHQSKRHLEYSWYYTFDVASGCIWNLRSIFKDSELIYKMEKYVPVATK